VSLSDLVEPQEQGSAPKTTSCSGGGFGKRPCGVKRIDQMQQEDLQLGGRTEEAGDSDPGEDQPPELVDQKTEFPDQRWQPK